MSQPKLIKIHTDGQRRVVWFSPEHINDLTSARRIATQITELLEERYGDIDLEMTDPESGEHELTIDMSKIAFLSSVGLNELIALNRQARVRGVQLVLADVQDSVKNILALTRLERLFRFSYDPQISPLDATESTENAGL